MNETDQFRRVQNIMARLRAPDGCPWDREQTLVTLKSYLLEETYEVLDAIDRSDVDAHQEELADLLFQIVFKLKSARKRVHSASKMSPGNCPTNWYAAILMSLRMVRN